MADHTDLIPANLKPGLTTPDGQDLKPSLVTPLYTGGTPTAADQIKPSLRDANGNLRADLVMPDGTLKPSVRIVDVAVVDVDPVEITHNIQTLGTSEHGIRRLGAS